MMYKSHHWASWHCSLQRLQFPSSELISSVFTSGRRRRLFRIKLGKGLKCLQIICPSKLSVNTVFRDHQLARLARCACRESLGDIESSKKPRSLGGLGGCGRTLGRWGKGRIGGFSGRWSDSSLLPQRHSHSSHSLPLTPTQRACDCSPVSCALPSEPCVTLPRQGTLHDTSRSQLSSIFS